MLNQMHNIENLKKYPISVSFPKGLDAVPIVQPLSNTKSGLYIMEIWKDIKDYEGYYQISNLGRVKSLYRIIKHEAKGEIIILQKILKVWFSSGYFRITLWKNNKRKTKTIHRLIALNFIPNPENKKEINHKNGIKTDNRIENLEWCTHKENMHHAIKNGLINCKGESSLSSKLIEKEILLIRKKRKEGYTYEALAKQFNVHLVTIFRIIKRRTWKHIK